MESNKHSPVVDDAMKDPRLEEPAGYRHEARPEDDDVLAGEGTIARRSDLARFIEPSRLPAGRDALLAAAADHDAPEWVRSALARLPQDRTFSTFEEVWESVAGPAA
jgi:Protein of unknown function (DUF2795)